MDRFAEDLSSKTGTQSAVLDLPNHGQSTRWEGSGNHERAVTELEQAVDEISNEREAHLIGHSYGAYLTLALAARNPARCKSLTLISLPFSFEENERFRMERLKRGITSSSNFRSEEAFKQYWEQLLPLYFLSAPTQEIISLLSARTYWLENQHFSKDAPRTANLIANLNTAVVTADSQSNFRIYCGQKITVIEGSDDILAPANQLQLLTSYLPDARQIVVKSAGHFPMLENLNELTTSLLSVLSR